MIYSGVGVAVGVAAGAGCGTSLPLLAILPAKVLGEVISEDDLLAASLNAGCFVNACPINAHVNGADVVEIVALLVGIAADVDVLTDVVVALVCRAVIPVVTILVAQAAAVNPLPATLSQKTDVAFGAGVEIIARLPLRDIGIVAAALRIAFVVGAIVAVRAENRISSANSF